MRSEALNYWINELDNRAESTLDLYLRLFQKCLDYVERADELIQQRAEDQRNPRTTLSSLVRNASIRTNEPAVSAHSLRKYLQTSLEAAGVDVSWKDQRLVHRLINSRDVYSKPTEDQLKGAYAQAYKTLRIYPEIPTPEAAPAQPAATQTKEKTNEFKLKTTQNIAEITKALSETMKQTAT